MKIGDKVRFLSETGGGKVAGFQGKNIILVEDEDGFQIPTQITDVVVVDNDDYGMGKVVEKKLNYNQKESTEKEDIEEEPADKPVTFRKPVEERKGGELLSAYLAFVPMDIKQVTNTRFEAYLVNDSNYYLHYTYLSSENNAWTLRSTGEIEPNTKLFIEEFGREELNKLNHLSVQLIAYKREKPFVLKHPIDVQFRIDGVKFYKLHTFEENDFFEQPALLYTIVENGKTARPLVVDAQKLKEEMFQKSERNTSLPKVSSGMQKKGDNSPLVIDLHADVLLETTAGMSATDILNYQLEQFRKTLAKYKEKKGTHIVFIHGKGEGVLRHALIHELNYRYKSYTYQDASFQEYGYGATQVTIK